MSIASRLRTHKDDIRLILELLDGLLFTILPGIVAMGAYVQGASSLSAALVVAIVSTISSFRMWIKRSPLAKRLGVEHTSMDLPRVQP